MKSSARNIELKSVDDLFATEESRADAQREKVQEIPLEELHPFPNHPFKINLMFALVQLNPLRLTVTLTPLLHLMPLQIRLLHLVIVQLIRLRLVLIQLIRLHPMILMSELEL